MSKCKSCRYGFSSGIDGITGCRYIIDKREPRDCPPGDKCTRYESVSSTSNQKNRKDVYKPMAKLSEETKREIVQLAMTGAMTHKAIAEKFGIGKSTVWYLVNQYKKSGEAALQEAVDEDFERFKSDDDNVYEVTADTDIEAYMADKKEEPETAATVTDSEQEIRTDIPADIIPDKLEDVKPESEKIEPLIPQSVIEACWGRIDDLRHQIAAEQSVIDDWERQIAEIKDFLELARIANPWEAEIDILMGDYEAVTGGAAV